MVFSKQFFIEPFVDTGLGNSAYLVGSRETGHAVMIDPLRDVERYRQAAERLGVRITHVLDTHLHNDFVSGARELAAQTGAAIGIGAGSQVAFAHQPLVADQVLESADVRLRVLATPGHTPEHLAFLLMTDEAPAALFSGGALMVGGAARTDLLGHEHAIPLARDLYHTLHDTLLKLPDEVGVYPTHGAGTFCSAPVSNERTTTIGRERRHNALALAKNEEDFIKQAMSNLPSYPVYYPHVRALNRRGPAVLGGLPVLKPLTPADVQAQQASGVLVLDVRPRKAIARGHVPGAYTIPLSTPLVTWAGWLIPFGTPLILVSEGAADRTRAVRELIKIGYDDLRGYLEGGMEAWARDGLPLETRREIAPAELRERLHDESLVVLDVRLDSEWRAGHIPGAVHIENGDLPWKPLDLPRDRPIAVHCAHGDRSTAAIAVLQRRGYHDLMHVEGGFSAWAEAGYEVTGR